MQPLGHPARRHHSHAVAIQQHLDHHQRIVGRPAPPLLLVATCDLRQVELVDDVGDEIGQVALGQPLLEGLWQQQLLVGIVGKVGLAH